MSSTQYSTTGIALGLLVLVTVNSKKVQTPNIVYVLIDDLGYADVGFRDPTLITPHFDSLAKTGLVLERHYAFKYCSPSRAALLTGRWPHHVHQYNIKNYTPLGLNINMTLLPAKLKQAGYATHMVGKWHGGFFKPEFLPINRGFDSSYGLLGGAADHVTQWRICAIDNWKNDGPDLRHGTYDTYTYLDEVDAIFANHNIAQPLFLYLPLHNVHGPYQAPTEWVNLYSPSDGCLDKQRCIYQAMVSIADNITGHVVKLLKLKRMWNKTVMVVSSDNGGEKCMGNNRPLKGAKGSFFEGGVKTLTFVNGGLLPPERRGMISESFVHISDWYATFCKLAGVDPSDSGPGKFPVDGKDIWPVITGENATTPHEEIVLGFNFNERGAIIVGDYKLIVGSQKIYTCDSNGDQTLKNDNVVRVCEPYCLYNIVKDPKELDNLVEKEPEKLKELIKRYNSFGGEPGEMQDQGYHSNFELPVFSDACEYMASHGGYWQPYGAGIHLYANKEGMTSPTSLLIILLNMLANIHSAACL